MSRLPPSIREAFAAAWKEVADDVATGASVETALREAELDADIFATRSATRADAYRDGARAAAATIVGEISKAYPLAERHGVNAATVSYLANRSPRRTDAFVRDTGGAS